jgi:hypothetical protein
MNVGRTQTFRPLQSFFGGVRGYTTDSACVKDIISDLNLLLLTLPWMYFYEVNTDYVGGLKLDHVSICSVRNIRLSCQIRVLIEK